MAKCRIQNIKPPCGYTVEGIDEILLLDFEDFKGYQFDGDGLYRLCLVTAVLRVGDFKELEAPDVAAKYASTLSNGIYAHTLETFIHDLSASTLSNLHLAAKRRHVPVFKGKNGKYYTFGYEAGASLGYTNQTAEVMGSLVTITCASIYPLFEMTAEALIAINIISFDPDFNAGAYCEII